MGNMFAGSEIIEIGIQIEKNGKDFYDELVLKTPDKQAKEAFRELAAEEEKHIARFQKLLDGVTQYEPPEAYPGEYFAYMNALASEHVFAQKGKGKELAKKVKGCSEAIGLGLGFEKDSIIFYYGMEKIVPEHDKRIVHELVKEEQKHLKRLVELKKACRL
ncbi:MAG: ferritin family protein [Candidatus Omnitrophota bacterium]